MSVEEGIRMLPYGRHLIDDEDVDSVVRSLRSSWLTTGPNAIDFERAVAGYIGANHAVAVSSGTAALHAAMYALGIKAGDEVLVPAMTFAASANCVVFQGGTPVFVDVQPDTLLIDPEKIEERITPRTKAIIAVDYAGQPCDYDKLRVIADRHDLALIADACHSLGGKYKGRNVGMLADMTVFSFHPVKHITTGEGGMIVTNNEDFYKRVRLFRNHGITKDFKDRELDGTWFYEIVDLGYNYRITDFQCALGISQLNKLPDWLSRRRSIAKYYDDKFNVGPDSYIRPLTVRADVEHAYHLYVIRLGSGKVRLNRKKIFSALKRRGIGVNVHYIPVHLHPYYRNAYGTLPGLCPVAEAEYERIISLPIFPGMGANDASDVVSILDDVITNNR